jgi:type IV pilus assembly protein PilV
MTSLNSNEIRTTHGQRGMTLVEILVAIVVLSVGLLGLAGLQLKGLQVNQGSTFRWQAAMLAQDMADRMRADRAGASNGNYTQVLVAGSTPSSTSASAQTELQDWWARVQMLPGANAKISAPGGPANNQVTITVGWLDTRAQVGTGQTTTASGLGTPSTPALFALATEF